VTERDLTRALTAGLGPDAGVASVCVTDFVSIDEATTVVDAAGAMLDYDVRHLVVHNHRGATVGLVSLRDLVRVLVDAMDPAVWVVLSQRLAVHAAIPIE
jgi:CBS domain-containing protein